MNFLREMNSNDPKYQAICFDCITDNDRRFKIKNKINNFSNSIIKEQKGYKLNTCLINGIDNVDSLKYFNRYIRYLSTRYDSIHLECTESVIDFAKEMFLDDTTIVINKNDSNAFCQIYNLNNISCDPSYDDLKIYEFIN